jgi:hypothetical protein
MQTEDDLKPEVELKTAEILENPESDIVVIDNPLASKPRGGRKDYSSQRYEKDAETSSMVTRLAKLGLSKNAVAIAARLSPIELTRWYNEEYAAGQAGMQEVVARGLMEQAISGNPQVLMYLGKSKLGWTENNVVEHVGTINAVVSAKPLSREEFEAKYLNPPDETDDVG